MFQRPVSTDAAKIDELITRSMDEIIPSADSLRKLLTSGKRLRIKLGIDPTSPNIHIGRSVTLLKLRDFQELGHQIVLIVGDFTAVIGDTSDKDAERPMLGRDAIEVNKKTYFDQAAKILDISKVEKRNNSEWLGKLTYREIGEHADLFSVADFIARDNIKRRLDEGKRVSLREVLYPLMQGYDSVAVKADVELGGTDQRFNLLAGRTLQQKYGQAPQHIVMTELIAGTDGRKMSSSWGNTINLTDTPSDMFGKIMSIPDTLTEVYFTHVTRVPLGEIQEAIKMHPKDAKMLLAEEIVTMYYDRLMASKARSEFVNTFSKGEVPKDIPEIRWNGDVKSSIIGAGVVSSKSEYRRLEEGNAVTILSDNPSETVVRIGKHRFVKIKK